MEKGSYACAMGRVRAAERKMLNQGQLDRMVEAGAADEALKVLREAGYGGLEPGTQFSAFDYEQLIENENERLAAFILEISPEPGLMDIFLAQYDYHNLKVLLKAEFMRDAGMKRPRLSASGAINPDALERIVRERAFAELPAAMAAGIRNAMDAFRVSASVQAPDPQTIDVCLDRAMYAQMLDDARKLKNPFVEKLVKIYVDIANIASFIRIRGMHKSVEFLRGVLIPGGEVDCGMLARCYPDALENFVLAMRFTPYAQLCADGVKSFSATGRLTVFERCADDYVGSYIKKVKLAPLGLEIVAAYIVARRTELKNVRIVMVGKINNMAREVIKERLRECYA